VATQTIKRIDPVQYGKLMAILTAIVCLIGGIIMTLFAGLIMAMIPIGNAGALAAVGLIGGLITTVVLVIAGLIGGFISGVISAFIYNFVAGLVGGIKIDLE